LIKIIENQSNRKCSIQAIENNNDF
jgi:hypothetical protein